MVPSSDELEKGIKVHPSFNSKQIALIDSLIGEFGNDRPDVVRTIFLNYLSEKGITTLIIKKKLNLS